MDTALKFKVFISYRRDDTKAASRLIYEDLQARLGRDRVFFDIDSIPLGEDFLDYLSRQVAQSHVVLAVIGERWTAGKKIQDDNDFVRIELEAALGSGIPVLPIFVDGARAPRFDEVPVSLRQLLRRNGLLVDSGRDFRRNMQDVVSLAERLATRFLETQIEAERLSSHQQAHNAMPAGPPLEHVEYGRAVPQGVWLAFHSESHGLRLGAIYELARLLPTDSTGEIRELVLKAVDDLSPEISAYAKQVLGSDAAHASDANNTASMEIPVGAPSTNQTEAGRARQTVWDRGEIAAASTSLPIIEPIASRTAPTWLTQMRAANGTFRTFFFVAFFGAIGIGGLLIAPMFRSQKLVATSTSAAIEQPPPQPSAALRTESSADPVRAVATSMSAGVALSALASPRPTHEPVSAATRVAVTTERKAQAKASTGTTEPQTAGSDRPREQESAAPAVEPTSTYSPPTTPADPGHFNKDAAVAALSVAASQATVCKRPEGPWGSGRAVVTFSSSGRVTTANVTGDPFGGTAVGGCVASVFRRAKIPPFSGDPVTVSKSFTIAP